VFAFLIAISEVNAFLAFRFFIWDSKDKMELLQFRRQLALALINKVASHTEAQDDTFYGLCAPARINICSWKMDLHGQSNLPTVHLPGLKVQKAGAKSLCMCTRFGDR
jgi:hypothetical protein